MKKNVKAVDLLTVADLQAFPVWQFANSESADETFVQPVTQIPVTSLTGRLAGTQITLANGQRIWALIGNIDPNNSRMTEHFLTLSVERDGHWFTLARYHDFDAADHGPEALSRFLGLTIDEVFPIAYDIRRVAKGEGTALKGLILKTPRERLSRSQIIAMAVP